MIIYVIIYHIRNNKNFNITMSIKYNTIISTIISTSCTAEKEKRKECVTIIAYIAIQRIYHNLFGSKEKRKYDTIYNNSNNK